MSTASPIWVKICANTSLEDAQMAAEAGADAVGFVFAPSPRRVTAAQVAAITPHLPPGLEKIGVFVDAGLEEICSKVRACRLTGVQLHFDSPPEWPTQLRQRLGAEVRILRVVHFGPDAAAEAKEIAGDPNVDAILMDSRSATAVGGTGVSFNWTDAREIVFGHPLAAKLIAAGGLTPENVREAIATLRPWGVDVVSGVESAPGRKDPVRVRAFIATARNERLQLVDVMADFAGELTSLLNQAGKPELAAQVAHLQIARRCPCEDDFCATFYTQYNPARPFGSDHYCLDLDPPNGMIILDIVSGQIAGVEVLYRDDVRQALRRIFA